MKRIPLRIASIITIAIMVFAGCSSPGGGENDIPVSFDSLAANGSPTETTTKLTLTFDKDITGLSADNITLTGNSTGAGKGTLTRTGTGTYELTVTNVGGTGGEITVSVIMPGYAIDGNGKTVIIYHYVAPSDIEVSFTDVTANGSETETTSKLVLTFDNDIAGLTASDITLTPGSTGAVKGELTRTGTGTYELTVNNVGAGGEVSVSVTKAGYAISGSGKTVTIYHYIDPSDIEVSFTDVTANGSETETTSKLTLTFDKDITDLSAENIVLTANNTGAVKGTLTRTGTGTYELTVNNVSAGGEISVSVTKAGYAISGSGKTVTIYHYVAPSDIEVSFTDVTANGSETETTSKLTLTFDQDIAGLTASDITLTPGSTGAVKGELTRTGTGVYELGVNGITVSGLVSLSVTKSGYAISGSPQQVNVNYAVPVAFTDFSANGSTTETTTKLTLTFNNDIAGLTASDITLTPGSTGAVKGELTRTGTGVYELGVSGITAPGQITVTVSKDGYIITPAGRDTNLYLYGTVSFMSLTHNGGNFVTTNKVTLTFDRDIPGLTADDITYTRPRPDVGGVKGNLTPKGNGVYELELPGISAASSHAPAAIRVEKAGYDINPAEQVFYVYYAYPITFESVSLNGSPATTATKLTISLSDYVQGLSASYITLGGNTGATIAYNSLQHIGTYNGHYELTVSGINQSGTLSITFSPVPDGEHSGSVITPTTRSVQVFYSP